MINDRLKEIIFKKLYSDLSRVEMIHYKTFIWFIDREEKYWYFRYDKSNGQLLWRYGFFSDFFIIFTMDNNEFVPILSSWVEEVLNCKVTTTAYGCPNSGTQVDEVLNHKVNTTDVEWPFSKTWVEDALNCKVTTTSSGDLVPLTWVEEVLSHKVTSTAYMYTNGEIQVDEVLNHIVSTTQESTAPKPFMVEEVLNHNVEN
jgi:hypothetical protein